MLQSRHIYRVSQLKLHHCTVVVIMQIQTEIVLNTLHIQNSPVFCTNVVNLYIWVEVKTVNSM